MYNSVLKIIKIALVHLQESVFRVEVVQYAEKRALRPAWLRDHLWPCSVFCEVIPLGPALGEFFRCQSNQYFAKKPLVFGQEAPAVLHRHVQGSPLHLRQ